MNAKLLSLTVLAVLAATSAVAVVEASPGTLSKDSPLYPLLQQATDHFKCEGNACIFTLSDQTGENGTCVPPKVPRIPGNTNPTVEEFWYGIPVKFEGLPDMAELKWTHAA